MNCPTKRWSRLCLLGIVLGLNGTADADIDGSQPLDVPSLMELMAQITSRQDRFTEAKTFAMLTKPLILTGTLSYVRPDRVEKHVLTPYEEHLSVQGDQLTLRNKDGTKQIGVKSHPLIWSLVEAIRASLSGDVTTLRRFYHVKIDGTQRDWILTLRPLNEEASSYLSSIALRGRDARLMSIEVKESGGDRSVMTIHGPPSS